MFQYPAPGSYKMKTTVNSTNNLYKIKEQHIAYLESSLEDWHNFY